MRRQFAMALSAMLVTAVFADGESRPLRNPFWPIGYVGVKEVITAEPRVKIAVSTKVEDDPQIDSDDIDAAPDAAGELATPQIWKEACKTLAVENPLIAKTQFGGRRSSVSINGKVYADGDYISVTHAGKRFTWKMLGLNDSYVLKLTRIRVRNVEEPQQDSGKGRNK